eukprot:CAMPEP_0170181592 /NCGR_PEP_ID=MMETSP0040_2-20121228/25522_1 /TAXON_ID=641309 /ORGANISM="Lotharella oceanica, Strain CCMP622" /LENGTH=205 /DNA_ID=CAMNT_0010426699 /DNA_START=133 /DNA_END=745 /DNA_ORIENTATION=+
MTPLICHEAISSIVPDRVIAPLDGLEGRVDTEHRGGLERVVLTPDAGRDGDVNPFVKDRRALAHHGRLAANELSRVHVVEVQGEARWGVAMASGIDEFDPRAIPGTHGVAADAAISPKQVFDGELGRDGVHALAGGGAWVARGDVVFARESLCLPVESREIDGGGGVVVLEPKAKLEVVLLDLRRDFLVGIKQEPLVVAALESAG